VTGAAVDAGLADQPWRFPFVTRLTFSPPLAPAVGPASVLPTVVSEATRSFAADLPERDFEAVERGRRERLRTDAGGACRTQPVGDGTAGVVDCGRFREETLDLLRAVT